MYFENMLSKQGTRSHICTHIIRKFLCWSVFQRPSPLEKSTCKFAACKRASRGVFVLLLARRCSARYLRPLSLPVKPVSISRHEKYMRFECTNTRECGVLLCSRTGRCILDPLLLPVKQVMYASPRSLFTYRVYIHIYIYMYVIFTHTHTYTNTRKTRGSAAKAEKTKCEFVYDSLLQIPN